MSDSYPDAALVTLKRRGYRVTRPRRLVLEVLDAAEVPLSAYEIADRIKEGGDRGDVVSVYRILQTLEENALIHKVLSSGKFRKCHLESEADCERHQARHCHHNILCSGCGAIEEFHCPGMDLFEQLVASHSSYRIESHSLELVGLCGRCQRLG